VIRNCFVVLQTTSAHAIEGYTSQSVCLFIMSL